MSNSFVILWIVAHQTPLSLEFSRQEYWNGLPFPAPGDHPDPGIEPKSLVSPALAGGLFTTVPTGQPTLLPHMHTKKVRYGKASEEVVT